MKRLLLAALPCVLIAGSPAVPEKTGAPARSGFPSLTHTVVLTKLDGPWDMAFLPDGTMFFTEKCLGLSVRLPSGAVVKLLGMKDSKGYAATANDLFCEGQAGMQGVAVDPNFASNRFIYVYATSSLTAPGTNRVLRLKVNDAVTAVSGRVDIVTDIPYKPKANDLPFGGPGAHNGGRIRFSPGDGYLYVTTGDTHNGVVPQSPTLIGGKVLRIGTARPHRRTGRRLASILASIPTVIATRRASRSGRAPTNRSPPKTARGTATRSRRYDQVVTGAGIPVPTLQAVGPARPTTAATARIRWARWIPRSVRRTCR